MIIMREYYAWCCHIAAAAGPPYNLIMKSTLGPQKKNHSHTALYKYFMMFKAFNHLPGFFLTLQMTLIFAKTFQGFPQ